MRFYFFVLFLAFFIFSCTGKSSGTDAVYADYTITADEEAENVTCVLTFHQNGSQGRTLFLEPPAVVRFDGAALQGDSAGLSGAYYEVQKPLAQFSGTHTILFKSSEKEYTETFTFQPFAITQEFEEQVPRGDIALPVTGLAAHEPIRVLLTDTSFATADINEIDTVKNGQLVITKEALRNVASGPVTLHLYKEVERRLQHPPAGGGKLSITYGLSREFELVDE